MSKIPWKKAISLLPSIIKGLDHASKQQLPSPKRGSKPLTAVTQKETPFWTEDSTEKVYLTDKHPEVVAICLIAWEFAQLLNNRDHKSLDGSVEYHLYAKDYRNKLFYNKDPQTTTKYFTKNKVKSYCNSVEILSACFDKGFAQAKVIYQVEIVITEAADKCFKALNKQVKGKPLDKNIPYKQTYTLTLIKEDGLWKINNFEPDQELIGPGE